MNLLLAAVGGALVGALIVYFWRLARIAELTAKNAASEQVLREMRESQQKMGEGFRLAAFDAFQQVKKESDSDVEKNKEIIALSVEDMRKRLEEYQKIVHTFEKERSQMYGNLEKSLSMVLDAEGAIRRETSALKKALTTSSGVRGNWGQAVLEQILEQNDLVKGIGFDTQVSLTADDGSQLRPDFVVYLPGGKKLIIDAKEVASEYLQSQEADDPEIQRQHCEKLVANIRTNFIKLGRKEYQSVLDPDVRFVIMFIPSEGAIRAAFTTDSGLFQEAKERHVILASPMTIVPLIQLIAQTWQQQRLADNARELGAVVEVLGDRLYTFVEHLQSVRSGIKKAADSWDDAMSSWRKRVAPQVERTRQLGGKIKDFEHPELLSGDISDSPLQKKSNLIE